MRIDVDAFVDRLGSPDHAPVATDLVEVGFRRTLDLLATYAGSTDDLEPWLSDAEVNRDRSLRLMYLAGLGLNRYAAEDIYEEILEWRTSPEGLLTGSPERIAAARAIMGLR